MQVFISYRKADLQLGSAYVRSSLARHLGRHAVFRDVDDMPVGDFERSIERAIGNSRTVLVLIGPNWVAELQRRATLPEVDHVRREIELAWAANKRVIPVTMAGARLPGTAELPAPLASLAVLHALELQDRTWDHDIRVLARKIGLPFSWPWLLVRVSLAIVAIAGGVHLALPLLPDSIANNLVALRCAMGASLAAYLAAEWVTASIRRRRLEND